MIVEMLIAVCVVFVCIGLAIVLVYGGLALIDLVMGWMGWYG